jgi:N-acetylglucosaminyl-diphospho-decaprenol L-rhamnosyltransferase
VIADGEVKLAISIVTWRASVLTIDCLAALAPEMAATPDARVIVVDNHSGDGTAEAIEEAISKRGWSSWVQLIRSPTNGGFAAGNNLALREALQRYPALEFLMLLNPDTLPRAGSIGAIRGFMEVSPSVGIAGGQCEDPDGTPQECSFRFPGIVSEFSEQVRLGLLDRLVRSRLVRMGSFDVPVEADWVSGAAMMIRRSVFDSVGLMDEGYFLYFEETDFTLRARRAGWRTWHVPQARIVHFVGQSTGVRSADARPRRLPAYWFESRRRYYVLNFGLVYALAVDLAVIAGNALWRVRRILERKPPADPPYWIRDLVSKGVLCRGIRGLSARHIA